MDADPTSIEPNTEVMRALDAHEFSVYDLKLQILFSGKECDILKSLPRESTYLVDNNVSWKKLAAAYPNLNFVLGCTVSEEAENLQGVLFSNFPHGGYSNVFTLDLVPKRRETVVFHRLDTFYQKACLSGPIPALSQDSAEHFADRVLAANSLRQHLDQFLDRDPMVLQRAITDDLSNCSGNFSIAGNVAGMVTARFLQSLSPQLRAQKLDPAYLNLPGDTRLIAEALFFGFAILSHDERDVHAMAKMAKVSVTTSDRLKRKLATPI